MFEVGSLLYFEPFIFKNGAKPKNKYMIVLGGDSEGQMILASLPTSKDHVPSDIVVNIGCIDLPNRQVNVFVFPAKKTIAYTQQGIPFSFKVNTFVYGSDIDSYPVLTLNQQISELSTNVKVIGKLADDCFSTLIKCLKDSKMVKNKFKHML